MVRKTAGFFGPQRRPKLPASAYVLSKEYVTMQREPPPFVWAVPDKNISTWNYIVVGETAVLYSALLTELSSVAHLIHLSPEENMYHGLLLFPSEYPFRPPGIKMLTSSGRFHPDKICFSMSDFILDLCVYHLPLPTCRSYCASGTPLGVLRQCAFTFFFGHHLSWFTAGFAGFPRSIIC
ncbi:hypothetical protein ARMGADRAFT_1068463, partial [Armillaria gallica]